MPKLSKQLKDDIRAMLTKNFSYRKIEKLTKVPKSVVHKFASSINLNTENPGGRPKLLKPADATFLVTQMASGKSKTAAEVSKILSNEKGITISAKTVARELHNAGMKARTKKKKPAISQKNQKERLAFAKAH